MFEEIKNLLIQCGYVQSSEDEEYFLKDGCRWYVESSSLGRDHLLGYYHDKNNSMQMMLPHSDLYQFILKNMNINKDNITEVLEYNKINDVVLENNQLVKKGYYSVDLDNINWIDTFEKLIGKLLKPLPKTIEVKIGDKINFATTGYNFYIKDFYQNRILFNNGSYHELNSNSLIYSVNDVRCTKIKIPAFNFDDYLTKNGFTVNDNIISFDIKDIRKCRSHADIIINMMKVLVANDLDSKKKYK